MYQAKIEALELKLAEMERKLLKATALVEKNLGEMMDDMMGKIEKSLDQHTFGGDGFVMSKVIDKIDELIIQMQSVERSQIPFANDAATVDQLMEDNWSCAAPLEEEDLTSRYGSSHITQ
jgi:hypothetical protein